MEHILKAYIQVIHEKLGAPISQEELESLYGLIKENPAMKKVVQSFPPELAPLSPEEMKREIHRILDDCPEVNQLLGRLLHSAGQPDKLHALTGSHGPARTESGNAEQAKAVEGWFKRLNKGKWMGKKGLAVLGATVALGAVIYGAKKYFEQKRHGEESRTWDQRLGQQAAVSEASPNAPQSF